MEYLKFKSLLRRVIVVPMVVTAALAALAVWQALVGDWKQPTPRLNADYRTSRDAV